MTRAQKQIRYAIDKGYVTSKEIISTLGGLEKKLDANQRIGLCDDIASASRWYTLDGAPSFFGRLYLAGKDIIGKAAGIGAIVTGAAVGAQVQAAKALTGTLVADKLTGYYDSLLFWLGQKSIETNGLEVMNAMVQMFKSTPSIMLGMGVGALGGWLVYKMGTYVCKSWYNGFLKNRAAAKISRKYALDSTPSIGA